MCVEGGRVRQSCCGSAWGGGGGDSATQCVAALGGGGILPLSVWQRLVGGILPFGVWQHLGVGVDGGFCHSVCGSAWGAGGGDSAAWCMVGLGEGTVLLMVWHGFKGVGWGGGMSLMVWQDAGELWRSWRGKVQGNYGVRGVVRCRGTMAFVAW